MENQETQNKENQNLPVSEPAHSAAEPAVNESAQAASAAEGQVATSRPHQENTELPQSENTPEPVQEESVPVTFDSFGFHPEIKEGILDAGYSVATSIQAQAIPAILTGKDVIGSAQTGTGKTAAFVLPILQLLMTNKKPGIRALILSPTRELATQISDQIWGLGYHTGISSCSIIGGTDWADQADALKKGANVVIATPGRLLDQMRDMAIDFSQVEIFVLDEADRMLDMGFIPAVMNIVNRLPQKRQNLMFSATIPGKIKYITQKIMTDPIWVNVATFKAADTVTQTYYVVPEFQKTALLEMLIKTNDWKSVIVFTGTKKGADLLAGKLNRRQIPVAYIHGDRTQEERDAALNAFKAGQYRVLVATDVLARGIDISDVSLIVNFDIPRDIDDYIHRIGRTGRAETEGSAISLVSPGETRYLDNIVERVGISLNRVEIPEDIQTFLDTKIRKPEHPKDRHHRHKDRDHRQPRPDPELGEVIPQEKPAAEEKPVQEARPQNQDRNRNQQDNRNRQQNRKPQGDGQPRQQDPNRPQQRENQQQGKPQPEGQQNRQQNRRPDGQNPNRPQGQRQENRQHQGQGGRNDRRGHQNQGRNPRQFEKPASRPARKDDLKLSQPGGFFSGLFKKLFGKK
ncbi:MAG: DEAD/DEAH box helicase [Bacteroidetes bacterium]|nr:DEAD/DEAH box helicase [Bacteroidota bacterium]